MDSNQLVLVCDVGSCDLKACPLFLVFPGTSSTPLSPPLVLEVGIVPQVPTASASPHIWTLKWVHEELGSATG
jgi:hypothetical protein